ncbi:MAG: hypothetical protein MK186_07605 [Henriciella sp.]|nr:hypothetical protein [Henriciella sp.]
MGRVTLAFDANTTRFGNLKRQQPEPDFG